MDSRGAEQKARKGQLLGKWLVSVAQHSGERKKWRMLITIRLCFPLIQFPCFSISDRKFSSHLRFPFTSPLKNKIRNHRRRSLLIKNAFLQPRIVEGFRFDGGGVAHSKGMLWNAEEDWRALTACGSLCLRILSYAADLTEEFDKLHSKIVLPSLRANFITFHGTRTFKPCWSENIPVELTFKICFLLCKSFQQNHKDRRGKIYGKLCNSDLKSLNCSLRCKHPTIHEIFPARAIEYSK